MDDDTADIELLNKTHRISQQMTYVDRALLKIDEVASSQDGIAIEEGLVLRGATDLDWCEEAYPAQGYADMRWSWSRKALEMCSRRVVDRAGTLNGEAAGKEFSIWIENLLKVTEVLSRVVVFTLQIHSRAWGGELSVGITILDAIGFALSVLEYGNWKWAAGNK
ncbi:hypothetical protein CY34DRAFT_107303 [Suillus luteus UH-Slu-Lm8-n1]|uniref:Uncharacterized protein n=1 Tax=Suillus luteus UH-Slu-Lm8-n1 TaxID=930992 RepID=A0A0D0BDV9_9AGAM|nr:hypothetical protein CY34DRAFT_107303 [Suillus luteus UH-Slu-Lm8-n1]